MNQFILVNGGYIKKEPKLSTPFLTIRMCLEWVYSGFSHALSQLIG